MLQCSVWIWSGAIGGPRPPKRPQTLCIGIMSCTWVLGRRIADETCGGECAGHPIHRQNILLVYTDLHRSAHFNSQATKTYELKNIQ